MVKLIKHEWHSVDSQFTFELDLDKLQEIYPDASDKELKKMLKDIKKGEYDIETLMNDAMDNSVDIDWEREYDDWWSERKGGYEVTYEVDDA